jgi:hypothetical protein
MQYIYLGGVLLGGLVVFVIIKRCFLPEHGSVAFTAIASTLICLFGIGVAGVGGYAYFVGIEMINVFVGLTSLLGMMLLGGVLIAMTTITFIGFCAKSRCIFSFVLLLQVRECLHCGPIRSPLLLGCKHQSNFVSYAQRVCPHRCSLRSLASASRL